jgi:hypothetical protein
MRTAGDHKETGEHGKAEMSPRAIIRTSSAGSFSMASGRCRIHEGVMPKTSNRTDHTVKSFLGNLKK